VRRGSILQLTLLGLVAAAITTAVAIFIPWLPKPAAKEADRINFVYWFATVIAIVVFAVVAAVLSYAVLKFRVRPDDDSDGPPTHGHTGLEIVWTIIPAVLVTAISIVSAIVLAQNSRAGTNPVKIKVTAQQFAWQFTYSNGQTYGFLRVPKGRHVQLEITSKDVLHSFWVPEFAQKQDAVPGQFNKIVVTPTRLGTFPVICTELCGLGHAIMRSRAEVVTPAKFKDFLAHGVQTNNDPALATFDAQGCNGCHTYGPAKSAGQIGPSLDDLKQEAAAANQPLDKFVRESIVDPNAYVAPHFQAGVMPQNFKDQIPADKLDQLVQYLVSHAK
jgi:cytochrome c oxidase subunit 2